MNDSPIVVVGAGLAGGTAATTLRGEGWTGRVVLVGDEPGPPYERPALSKGYLLGTSDVADIASRPASAYTESGVETRFGARVATIDVAGRAVVLDDGERIGYHQLLVATGARNRRPPIPGLDLPGVHALRTLADADRLRDDLASVGPGARVVVLGMGFVGSEVAASLRTLGHEVTVVEALDEPLARAVAPEVASVVRDVHAEHGVRLVLGHAVAALDGDDRVRVVLLDGGRELPCDLVVFGFGADPDTDLAATAGLEVDGGIVVDEHGRTSAPDVYAVGDATAFHHPLLGHRLRVEHWQHAVLQARAVVRSMLGTPTPYAEVPWFWSDQYDLHLHHTGFAVPWDTAVVRGDVGARRFAVFHLAEGRLVSTSAVNLPLAVRQSMPLIAARAVVDPAALADPAVRLSTLAPA